MKNYIRYIRENNIELFEKKLKQRMSEGFQPLFNVSYCKKYFIVFLFKDE